MIPLFLLTGLWTVSLGFLRVARIKNGNRYVLVDEHNRQRVLRGVNLGVEWWSPHGRPIDPKLYTKGRCPKNNNTWQQPPVCEVDAGSGKYNQSSKWNSRNDFAQIRAAGFSVVRLAISWSVLEPQPLQYSDMYVDRIAQVVSWCSEQDIYVIIDFHQDNYGYGVPNGGADGAPIWASPTPYELNTTAADIPAITRDVLQAIGHGLFNPILAFDRFWHNALVNSTNKGLQEHYILAAAHLARRFLDNPTVLGYEIMNEPLPSATLDIFAFSSQFLYPFYARFIQALTGTRDGLPECPSDDPISAHCHGCCAHPDLGVHATNQLFFFEPCGLRNQLDFSPQLITKPFTQWPNIVYAPHTYTHSFTKWKDPFWLALDSAIAEATVMHAAVFVTEFGAPSVEKKLLEMLDQQDMHGVGSTFWPWKERGGWGMFNHSGADPDLGEGPMKPLHRRALCRILPVATVGLVTHFSYNWTTAAFSLHAVAPPAITQHATTIIARTTIVFVPAHVPPAPCEVTGAAQFSRSVAAPDGSRQLMVNVTAAGGEYSIYIPGNATWSDV